MLRWVIFTCPLGGECLKNDLTDSREWCDVNLSPGDAKQKDPCLNPWTPCNPDHGQPFTPLKHHSGPPARVCDRFYYHSRDSC